LAATDACCDCRLAGAVSGPLAFCGVLSLLLLLLTKALALVRGLLDVSARQPQDAEHEAAAQPAQGLRASLRRCGMPAVTAETHREKR
jgi:hypothetical protein